MYENANTRLAYNQELILTYNQGRDAGQKYVDMLLSIIFGWQVTIRNSTLQ
jgi:hypothetical protein